MVFGGAKSSKSLVQVKQAVDMQVIVYVFREISSLFITIIHMYASTRAHLIHPCAGSKYFYRSFVWDIHLERVRDCSSRNFLLSYFAGRVLFDHELRQRLEKLKAQVIQR